MRAGSSTRAKLETVRYVLSYGERGWTSRMHEDDAKQLVEVLGDQCPPRQMVEALDACCDFFYPRMRRSNRPWHEHKNKPKGERKAFLLEKATGGWPIDWYWKILLTSLPKLLDPAMPSTANLVLSQVRHWVLLAACKLSESEVDGGAEASQQRRLLRPPIFGQSNRIADWDQYWIYLLNRQQIVEHWTQLRSTDPIERAYVLGRHDVVYRIDKGNIQFDEALRTITVRIGGELDLRPVRVDFEVPVKVEGTAPYDLVEVPRYWDNHGRPGVNRPKRNVQLLLAAEPVCEAVARLSDAWNDPALRSLHINAPPGSGKEVLSDTVYWFRDFRGSSNNAKNGHQVIVALSPHDEERNEAALFGGSGADNGLVMEAQGGCLVLDEIDKVSDGTRASLLRLLESDEFLVPGTSNIRSITASSRPLYLLLSSRPFREVMKRAPVDLWTRVQATVAMSHPLASPDPQERARVLEQYFHMFWNDRAAAFLRETLKDSGAKVLEQYYSRIARLFLGTDGLARYVSQVFARLAATSEIHAEMSIRQIRGIAQKASYLFAQAFLFSDDAQFFGIASSREELVALRLRFDEALYQERYDAFWSDHQLARQVDWIVQHSLSTEAGLLP